LLAADPSSRPGTGGTLDDIGNVEDAIGDAGGALADAQQQWKDTAVAEDAAGSAAAGAAGPVNTLTQGVKDAANATKEWQASLQKLNDTLSNRSSVRDYEAAIDAARKALKENGKTLDENTEKGRNNEAALDAIAQTALAHAAAMDKDNKSIKQQRAFLEDSRKALIDAAEGFGMSAAAAKRYADRVLDIPKVV